MRKLLLGLAIFLAACSLPKPSPTATTTSTAVPTATQTPSQVPSATSTPTLVPTATPTFTPSPLPSPTYTPLPTPTPDGYYAHQTAGFDLIHPPGWDIQSEDSSGVNFFDSVEGVGLTIFRDSSPDALTFKQQVAMLIASATNYKLKQQSTGTVQLADGVSAESADLAGADSTGQKLAIRLAYAQTADRRYILLVFGAPQTLKDQAQTVQDVFASIHLTHDVYGLPRAQTLVLLGGDPSAEALDPALTQGSAAGFVGLLYSGLVRLTPQLQIVPSLAESWTISPSGDVYTFTLRAGLTFQSGAPLNAEAVRYSWERAADPKTKSPTAGTYLGDIVGVKDKLAGKADHISGLTVVDARTLVVHLDTPKAYFLAKLTYPTGFVVDQKNVASSADRWMFHPNASGPYGLKEYRQGEVLIFERNAAYYAPPAIADVVFRIQAGGTPLSLYESGDLDETAVFGSDLPGVQSPTGAHHAELQSTTSLCTTLLLFDVTQPPLDDPAVRQALALALDRDTLITRLDPNGVTRADAILPPGMPGFSTDFPILKFDKTAARAALAKSRYAGHFPTLILNESGQGGTPSAFLTAVADMWHQNLGLTVQIKQLDPSNYTKAAREQHNNVVSYGWCADYPDPENFLDILFHTGSDFNVAGYSDPQVDTWLEAARSEPDPSQRLALYHQVETKLIADVAVIPWENDLSNSLVKPYVKGWVETPMGVPLIPLLSLESQN